MGSAPSLKLNTPISSVLKFVSPLLAGGSSLGNDANGGTDLTESNLTALNQTTDTCTNNFCTLNPLINSGGNYSNGNCKLDGGSDNKFVWGTMGTSMNNSNAGNVSSQSATTQAELEAKQRELLELQIQRQKNLERDRKYDNAIDALKSIQNNLPR